LAGKELAHQKPDVKTVVTASSSGSTQVGLSYAFVDREVEVVGILCDPEPNIGKDFANLGATLATALGESRVISAEDFRVVTDFVGPGYGVISEAGQDAIRYLARTEGIFLDPVYSGKAFAGLTALVEAGKLEPPIVFWHTGGTPALFAFS
jgi:1-aminocyclopropane-1-carboxylate deaminase/D-cysteine desulfhydrase-like pyridoxal-dependent ACC family enzyme